MKKIDLEALKMNPFVPSPRPSNQNPNTLKVPALKLSELSPPKNNGIGPNMGNGTCA